MTSLTSRRVTHMQYLYITKHHLQQAKDLVISMLYRRLPHYRNTIRRLVKVKYTCWKALLIRPGSGSTKAVACLIRSCLTRRPSFLLCNLKFINSRLKAIAGTPAGAAGILHDTPDLRRVQLCTAMSVSSSCPRRCRTS
jgi:hypothetical protein